MLALISTEPPAQKLLLVVVVMVAVGGTFTVIITGAAVAVQPFRVSSQVWLPEAVAV